MDNDVQGVIVAALGMSVCIQAYWLARSKRAIEEIERRLDNPELEFFEAYKRLGSKK